MNITGNGNISISGSGNSINKVKGQENENAIRVGDITIIVKESAVEKGRYKVFINGNVKEIYLNDKKVLELI